VRGRGAPGSVQSVHYKFSISNETCFEVVAADGFLPEVLQILKNYRAVLAREQQRRFIKGSPISCDAALNVLDTNKVYHYGFPLREWSPDGYLRFLEDYKVGIRFDPKFFELPAEYRRYSF
jgi:hypothetical protein